MGQYLSSNQKSEEKIDNNIYEININDDKTVYVDEKIYTIYMVCGYSRSGKDYLCEIMNNKKIKMNWAVYAHPRIWKNKERLVLQNVYHKSFAHELKKEVYKKLIKEKILDDKLITINDIEKIKDDILINNKTFRDYLIEIGNEERKKDPNIWCKKAFPNGLNSVEGLITKDGFNITHSLSENDFIDNDEDNIKNIIITDWRYLNELEYMKSILNKNYKITTIRLFTKNVNNSIYKNELEKEVEHLLDKEEPDYLLVPKKNRLEEIVEAIELFPQFGTYKWVGFEDNRK